MIKLILVRHGQSEWNLQNKFTGWTDVDLSQQGVQEAIFAGKLISKYEPQIDIAFTSVLKRAKHTLDLICSEQKCKFAIIEDYRLNERHYGALQGLNKAETAKKYGDEQVHLWRRSATERPPLLAEDDPRNPKFDPLYAGINAKLPLGESLIDTGKRVKECFDDAIKPKLQNGSVALIVAHGNSLRALIQILDKIDNDKIANLEIPTGKPLVYELDADFEPTKHYYLPKGN